MMKTINPKMVNRFHFTDMIKGSKQAINIHFLDF
jgi:hypothetical protein